MADDETKIAAEVSAKRRSSRMPQRDKSYIISLKSMTADVDNENDNDTDNKRNIKCDNIMFRILHAVARSLSLWALIFMIIPVVSPKDHENLDNKVAYIIAFSFAAFSVLIANPVLYKLNKTRTWLKVIDFILFVMFGIVTILAWVVPQSLPFMSPIAWGLISLGVAIAWLFGYPLEESRVADEVDPITLTHPLMVLEIRIVTGIYLGVLTISTIFSVPILVTESAAGEILSILANIIQGIGFAVGGCLFQWYFWNHMEKFAGSYEKEIDEWMEKHPTHGNGEFMRMSDQKQVEEFIETGHEDEPEYPDKGKNIMQKMLILQEEDEDGISVDKVDTEVGF